MYLYACTMFGVNEAESVQRSSFTICSLIHGHTQVPQYTRTHPYTFVQCNACVNFVVAVFYDQLTLRPYRQCPGYSQQGTYIRLLLQEYSFVQQLNQKANFSLFFQSLKQLSSERCHEMLFYLSREKILFLIIQS